MLNTYLSATQRLLQNPAASNALYATVDLTAYINTARGQVAGDGECIRSLGTVSTAVGVRNYAFSSINFGVQATTGILGAIHVRSILRPVGAGYQWVTPRAWEYFMYYCLANPVSKNAPPDTWSQYQQGAATPGAPAASSASGSFYLDPPPDAIYPMLCDCVCYPQPLVLDADVEAIPYFWTDAVPYFAAYLALMSSQMNARINDANRMLELYNSFIERARTFANASVNRSQYEQAGDPVQTGKLGLTKGGK